MSRAEALAATLLVQAAEESDPEYRILARAERSRATRRARTALAAEAPGASAPAGAAAASLLAARAALLLPRLEVRHPTLARLRARATLALPPWAVLAPALGVGLAANELGADRHVGILAFPLLGLILWNLGVYLALALARLRPRSRVRGAGDLGLAGMVLGAGAWLAAPERLWMRRRAAAEARWLVATTRRFLVLWARAAGSWMHARVRRTLHLAAAAFALGMVGGMYVRGIALEYRATWESTFLDADGVHALLTIVLGPAAALLGALPLASGVTPALLAPGSLEAVRAPATGPAAPWIHLWAVTALLAIVLPRTTLAVAAQRRARRLAAALAPPADDPWVLRTLAGERGAGIRVEALPYSYTPSPRAREELAELLYEVFGNRATVGFASPLAYGDTAAPVAASARVVVFSLAQAPEQDVHGELLESLKHAIEDGGDGGALLVVLDAEPYRATLGSSSARVEERRRAWERLVRDSGLAAVALEGDDPGDGDARLAAARARVWPRRAGAAA